MGLKLPRFTSTTLKTSTRPTRHMGLSSTVMLARSKWIRPSPICGR
ncbi:unnamed protein product [Linum tenue]|uniref:Uncharacterized protein n=1 Tax=Linum tenue TaxID=586396 RepID=A0AAV0JFT6_9ROSI|nr:unnamed protein product [Linum tenue]